MIPPQNDPAQNDPGRNDPARNDPARNGVGDQARRLGRLGGRAHVGGASVHASRTLSLCPRAMEATELLLIRGRGCALRSPLRANKVLRA